MNAPLLSVLIPTFNRAPLLRGALESLTTQCLPRDQFEVVVVDDGSGDNTRDIVTGFEASLCIRYSYQQNSGLAAAKNHAVELAGAPLLLFMDDDDRADEKLLQEHLASHARHPQESIAVLGYTGLAGEAEASPLMHFATEVGYYLYNYPQLQHGQLLDYRYFWGGRTSCKKSLLLDHGFFDPAFRFGCEDIELGYRLSHHGLRVWYNRRARTATTRAISLEQFCRRSEQQGYSNWLFYRKHPVPEVASWADIDGLDSRWTYFEKRLPSLLKSAAGLDQLARTRRKYDLDSSDLLLSLLHQAYWAVIDGYRVKGAWAASQRKDRP